MSRSLKLASLLGITAFASLVFASLAPSAGAVCLNALRKSDNAAAEAGAEQTGDACTFDSECPESWVCHQNRCHSPAAMQALKEQEQAAAPAFDPHNPPPEDASDGGADRVCGQNRRCRIQRLKTQNRARRHLDIAHQELDTRRQVERILARRRNDIHRLDKPWLVALSGRTLGPGILVGRTFVEGRLRAELNAIMVDNSFYHEPDDPDMTYVNGNQEFILTTAQATYLPSQRWFSPYLTVGFGLGSGPLYSYASTGSSGARVRYHLVTAAAGFEAQFAFGLNARLGITHGRVLYNQVFYGPGVYDPEMRSSLRDYMNTDGLFSFDFSLGWAF
ncbi:hypothetical protein DL240_00395 [Lujinxingia litoralis]|uniref:Outer membrane protein beta-barrel domain-containing protein n=1 Tax=Lujinxingia litoralis TaxID=2211119 RepID=A0A328CDG6_9DELT|nr:hypothetical protein [Lujinxingia litoralis]RAL24703.1 hypothetical protein DL240_00395 [Lujinxingia litoralis]